MKKERQEAILGLVASRRIASQEELRGLLQDMGFGVTQATLSRDLRELRLAKLPGSGGRSYYAPSSDSSAGGPALEALLPQLLVDVDGVGSLLVVRTVIGAAQAVAEAIDIEDWPEVIGTVAGDDTILLVIRETRHLEPLMERLRELAGR